MTEIQSSIGNEVKKTFEWKDRNDVFHPVNKMETKHLFFTLRMVWNHAAPEEARIEPYNKYNFSSFYTKEYMKQSIHHISKELSKRDDLKPYFVKNLKHMRDFMKRNLEVNYE